MNESNGLPGVFLILALCWGLTVFADRVITPALVWAFGNAPEQVEDVFETDGLASEEFR